MEGLNFTAVDGLLVIVSVSNSAPSAAAWQALHDVIVQNAEHPGGLLIIAEGDPPSAAGRSLMHAALTRASKKRLAFVTSHALVKMIISTVVRWALGGRVLHAPDIHTALQHLGVATALEAPVTEAAKKLRELGLREVS